MKNQWLDRLKDDVLPTALSILFMILFILLMVIPFSTKAESESASPPGNGAGRVVSTPETVETIHETDEAETALPVETIDTEEELTEPAVALPAAETGSSETDDLFALIFEVAAEYEIPGELVCAVCYVESGFDPTAKSDHPDYGLMQVAHINWMSVGIDPDDVVTGDVVYDPKVNLNRGCELLKEALNFCGGDFTKALMCYNRGREYAMSQWKEGIFATDYTDRVLSKYYDYLREGC